MITPLAATSPRTKPATERVAVVLVILVYVALAVSASLTIAPWSDEGGLANAAYNLAFHGFMGTTVFDEAGSGYTGVNQHTYYLMPLGMVIQAAFFRVLGFSALSMRMVSIIFGLGVAGAWFSIVRRLSGNRWLGYGTALILLTDYLFVMGSSSGRVDVICAGFGATGLALYLALRETNFNRALFFSNLCVAASGLTHPLGILYLAGLTSLVIYFDRARILGLRPLLAAALPYAIGAVGWGLYILQDPQNFVTQFVTCVRAGGRMSAWNSPLHSLKTEFTERYLRAFGLRGHTEGNSGLIELKALLLAVYALGVAIGLCVRSIRNSLTGRVVLMLGGIFFLLLTFIEGQRLNVYLVHILPVYAALVTMSTFWVWTTKPAWRWPLALVLAGFIALQTGGILLRIRQNTYAPYRTALSYVKQQVGNSQVAGGSQLGFGLGFDDGLLDDTSLGYFNHRIPDWIVVEMHYRTAFEYIETLNPEEYRYLQETLPMYEKVYDQQGYALYHKR